MLRNYYIGKTWKFWQLWLAIKPNLKCTQFSKYKAEYEQKIEVAEANIDKVGIISYYQFLPLCTYVFLVSVHTKFNHYHFRIHENNV